MKKFVFIVLASALVVSLGGCSKKQEALEEMQQPMSPEDLSRLSTENKQAPQAKTEAPATQAQVTTVSTQSSTQVPGTSAVQPAEPQGQLEKLPPSGPYKPTDQEIQTALKNAGVYNGPVDGKIGPLTKKSIEEFQKNNGLNPDGKVGPKTWAALSKYLTAPAAPVKTKKKK